MKSRVGIIAFFSLVAAVLILDVILTAAGGLENTVSWQVWVYSQKIPAIPFGIGFVCGHLFWQMKS